MCIALPRHYGQRVVLKAQLMMSIIGAATVSQGGPREGRDFTSGASVDLLKQGFQGQLAMSLVLDGK